MSTPSWAKNLIRKGNYYEGCVDDFDSLFEEYKQQTVTTWGTRRSTKHQLQVQDNKENEISVSDYTYTKHKVHVLLHATRD